jgi:predicted ATPase
MCLDVDYHFNNQNCIIGADFLENHNQNTINNLATMESTSTATEYRIKNLCGGSLIEHKPLFDPKGE